jgi:hypothetical protein
MKSKTIILILFFISNASFSQEVYPLHPSIGDTLELDEKIDYSLFYFIPNTGFKYATISFEIDSFYLNSIYSDSISKKVLTKEMIIEAQQNIEKINNYYRLKAEKDKLEIRNKSNSKSYVDRPTGKTPIISNPILNENMKKEARMNIRLQEDAIRMKEYQYNNQTRQLRIELK